MNVSKNNKLFNFENNFTGDCHGRGDRGDGHAIASTSSTLDMLVQQMANLSSALADFQAGSQNAMNGFARVSALNAA